MELAWIELLTSRTIRGWLSQPRIAELGIVRRFEEIRRATSFTTPMNRSPRASGVRPWRGMTGSSG
jgi:hypothetical protein